MTQNSSNLGILTVDTVELKNSQLNPKNLPQIVNKLEIFKIPKLLKNNFNLKQILHSENKNSKAKNEMRETSFNARSNVIHLVKNFEIQYFSVSKKNLVVFITIENNFFLTNLNQEKPEIIQQILDFNLNKGSSSSIIYLLF